MAGGLLFCPYDTRYNIHDRIDKYYDETTWWYPQMLQVDLQALLTINITSQSTGQKKASKQTLDFFGTKLA